jgi:hypothetical protein
MFERESMLNTLLVESFKMLIADIPADRICEPAPGNGHPPVWVLGHLAICAELGQKYCGGTIIHPEWLKVFGPGSADQIEDTGKYSKEEFADVIIHGYPALAELARDADDSLLAGPHGVPLLEGTPVQTSGDLVAHLLTSHLAFHLAQLSGWRRAAGHGPLF